MLRKLGLIAAAGLLMGGTAAFAADPPVPNSSPGPDGGKSPGVQLETPKAESAGASSQSAEQQAPDSGPGSQPKVTEGASKQ
jgi:hypothetical protein